jgi:hypothetical protein
MLQELKSVVTIAALDMRDPAAKVGGEEEVEPKGAALYFFKCPCVGGHTNKGSQGNKTPHMRVNDRHPCLSCGVAF